jgi:hypothetical protein
MRAWSAMRLANTIGYNRTRKALSHQAGSTTLEEVYDSAQLSVGATAAVTGLRWHSRLVHLTNIGTGSYSENVHFNPPIVYPDDECQCHGYENMNIESSVSLSGYDVQKDDTARDYGKK